MGMMDWFRGMDIVIGRHATQDTEIVEADQAVDTWNQDLSSEPVVETSVEEPYSYEEAVANAAQETGMSDQEMTQQIEDNYANQMEAVEEQSPSSDVTVVDEEGYSPEEVEAWQETYNVEPVAEQTVQEITGYAPYEESYGYSSEPEEAVEISNYPRKMNETFEEPEEPRKQKKSEPRFSIGEQVFYEGYIYVVTDHVPDDQGSIEVEVLGRPGDISRKLEKLLMAQSQVDSAEWARALAEQTTEPETETKEEEPPPEDSSKVKTEERLIIFFRQEGGSRSVREGEKFRISWQVRDVPDIRVILVTPEISNGAEATLSNTLPEDMKNSDREYLLVVQRASTGETLDQEPLGVALKVITSPKITSFVVPSSVDANTRYQVSWSVADPDNGGFVKLLVDGMEKSTAKNGTVDFEMKDQNQVWELSVVDNINNKAYDGRQETVSVNRATAGGFSSSLIVSTDKAKENDEYTVEWKITDNDSNNPEMGPFLLNVNNSYLSEAKSGTITEKMHRVSKTYVLYVSGVEVERKVVDYDDSGSSSGSPASFSVINSFDVDPHSAVKDASYKVSWNIKNDPNIGRIVLLCPGSRSLDIPLSDKIGYLNFIMEDSDAGYQIQAISRTGEVDSRQKVVRFASSSASGNQSPNNPNNTITYFEVIGGLQKRQSETVTINWTVRDAPRGVSRYVELSVDGSTIQSSRYGHFRLNDHYAMQMKDHNMDVILRVFDDNREIAMLSKIIVLSTAGPSVKERLANGESESKLKREGISDYSIRHAKEELESERRVRESNEHAVNLRKQEYSQSGGAFVKGFVHDWMKNVSAENVAAAPARETAQGKMVEAREKARADIIKADNTLAQTRIQEDTKLRLKELELAAKEGKGGAAGKMKHPFAPGGLENFVGSTLDEGKKVQEAGGGMRSPLNMDLGISPRLPEEEEEAIFDKTRNNSFGIFSVDSFLNVAPKVQYPSSNIGIESGIIGAPKPINPIGLNATMNRSASSISPAQSTSLSFEATPRSLSASSGGNVDPLRGKSAEELKSMGIQKQYVDRNTGWRMPPSSDIKIFTAPGGAQYYYVRITEKRRVGRPNNTFVADSSKIDNIIKKGISNTPTSLDDFASLDQNEYGNLEKDNSMIIREYGQTEPEFFEEKDTMGINVVGSKPIDAGANIAEMMKGKIG